MPKIFNAIGTHQRMPLRLFGVSGSAEPPPIPLTRYVVAPPRPTPSPSSPPPPFPPTSRASLSRIDHFLERRLCECRGKDKDKGEKRAKKRASASTAEGFVAQSVGASGKGEKIDGKADGKTDGKSGGASATAGKGKGKTEGKGALGGVDGGVGDGDVKNGESGGANLSSLLGAYGSDSDSSGSDA